MIIYLENFFRTGYFGEITLGATKQSVLDYLGPADSDNLMGDIGASLLYGCYELFFYNNDTLHYIQNDSYCADNPLTYQFCNSRFGIDTWFFNETLQDIYSIMQLLKKCNIDFQLIDYHARPVLKTHTGIHIDFVEDTNELGIKPLNAFFYSAD